MSHTTVSRSSTGSDGENRSPHLGRPHKDVPNRMALDGRPYPQSHSICWPCWESVKSTRGRGWRAGQTYQQLCCLRTHSTGKPYSIHPASHEQSKHGGLNFIQAGPKKDSHVFYIRSLEGSKIFIYAIRKAIIIRNKGKERVLYDESLLFNIIHF